MQYWSNVLQEVMNLVDKRIKGKTLIKTECSHTLFQLTSWFYFSARESYIKRVLVDSHALN